MLVESGIDVESFVLLLRGFELGGAMSAGDTCPDRGEPIIRKRHIREEA